MAAEYMFESLSLAKLLHGLAAVGPAQDIAVKGLSLDSRHVRPGHVFLAVAGRHVHGVDFVADALRAGASAVLWTCDLSHEYVSINADYRS